MPSRKELAEKFKQTVRRGRSPKSDKRRKPFVVAYDTGDGFDDGVELTQDQFFHILEDYDAVIVQQDTGDHAEHKKHYLLYGEAQEIDLTGEDLDSTEMRRRSKEVIGPFKWFDHGQRLTVNMSIGLHCRDTEIWNDLP